MKRTQNRRIFLLFTLIVLVFSILTVNVFVVSVMGYHFGSKTDIKEVVQGIHTVYDPVYAKRGNILDINENILVQDTEAYTVYAYIAPDRFGINNVPAYVTDKEGAASILATILDAPYDYILGSLNSDAKQVEFGLYGKYITPQQKRDLESHEIPGLGFVPAIKRDYYSSRFATTLLGITRFNENTQLQDGIMGIEKYYDDVLTGKNGLEVYRQDFDSYRFDTIESLSYEAENGKHIKLTIDKILQSALDNALNNFLTKEEMQAKEAWGAIIDIETGAILAMSDAPAFDVEDENTLYINRATEYEYEPGSSMKTITYAVGLNEGAIKPDDLFDGKTFYLKTDPDTGAVSRVGSPGNNTVTINNPEQEIYPVITFKEGFQRSSNVMIAELLTSKMDPEIFKDYMERLGFYKSTQVGRIPEASGTELWGYHHEKITNGYGQGSTVTMLQLLQAHTAIFGDGTVIKPYIVEAIIDPNTGNTEYQATVQKGEKVFTSETAQLVRDAMYENVNVQQFGNHRYKMDDISVMAKSGTAEMVIDGKYSPDTYIYSAMLGFPYENPKYAFYYAYQASRWHRHWSAAEDVKNVIKTVIATYPVDINEEPDEGDQAVRKEELENYINRPISEVTELLKSQGHEVVVLGNGSTVIDQYPQKGVTLLNNERILLLSQYENMVVPDMTGWSLKEVNAWSNFANIEVVISGSGFVSKQSISPNTQIVPDMSIRVDLE